VVRPQGVRTDNGLRVLKAGNCERRCNRCRTGSLRCAQRGLARDGVAWPRTSAGLTAKGRAVVPGVGSGGGRSSGVVSDVSLHARWVALHKLGSLASPHGETLLGEAVVAVGSDRLVLRRGTKTFWMAGRCKNCGGELASVDVPAHEDGCRGPVPIPAIEPFTPPIEVGFPAVPQDSRSPQPTRRTRRELRTILGLPTGHQHRRRTQATRWRFQASRKVLLYTQALVILTGIVVLGVLAIALAIWLGASSAPTH
jgi:hypothetical protein